MSRRHGHTLLEMLIVVLVLSITASVAMPRLNYVAMRTDANARVVRSVLQQAWRLSIQTQHDVVVSFDTTNAKMRILEDVNGDGLASAGERLSWRPLEDRVRFATPPTGVTGSGSPGPIAGAGLKILTGMPSIIFRRNGSASSDAQVYLGARSTRGTWEWRAITLAQSTGRTDWYRYANSVWRSGGI